jgi:hypothetical protein
MLNIMDTKFSYRALAMFMAFLMFSSSIGFSMDIHYCGGELESFSFFGDAEPCEMMQPKQEKKSLSCCEAPKNEIKSCHNRETVKGNCCHNESLVIDNGGELEISDFSLEQFQQVLVAIIVLFPNVDLFKTSNKYVNYTHYIPPPITKDISILHQVFRI